MFSLTKVDPQTKLDPTIYGNTKSTDTLFEGEVYRRGTATYAGAHYPGDGKVINFPIPGEIIARIKIEEGDRVRGFLGKLRDTGRLTRTGDKIFQRYFIALENITKKLVNKFDPKELKNVSGDPED